MKWMLLATLLSIWFSILTSLVVLFGAIRFWIEQSKVITAITPLASYPKVAVVVPAHNEELVIANTVRAILELNYPKEALSVYIYADNCTDKTADYVQAVFNEPKYAGLDVHLINRIGTGGKAGVLNDALTIVTAEYIAVYDADAIPERNALYFLVQKALEKPQEYMAVFGRNKTRNANQNLMTRFINQETMTSQRIQHVGMWELFKIGRIPGTNFIINTQFARSIGGWRLGALTEDTEISFEIYKANKLIALAHNSEAFEQEVETLSAYFHQRMRWSKGNYAVVLLHLKTLFKPVPWRVKLMTLDYAATFFWFIVAVVFSDLILYLNWINLIVHMIIPQQPLWLNEVADNKTMVTVMLLNWILMILIYVLNINIALGTQYGQSQPEQLWISVLSYFSYAQLFVAVSIAAVVSVTMDTIFKRDNTKWVKTERFDS